MTPSAVFLLCAEHRVRSTIRAAKDDVAGATRPMTKALAPQITPNMPIRGRLLVRRLLMLSSMLLAIIIGGVAVAEYDDHPFSDQPTIRHESASRGVVVQPSTHGDDTAGPSTELIPIVERTSTPTEPACFLEEVLAQFRVGADPATVAVRHGTTITSTIPQLGIYVLGVPPGTQAEKVAALINDPDVEYAEPNAVMGIPERPASGSAPCPAGSPIGH